MDKKEKEEEQVYDDELIVGEEAAEKGTFSDECQDEDKVDTEEASDSSDVADLGKLCKKWEKYPIGHKLER